MSMFSPRWIETYALCVAGRRSVLPVYLGSFAKHRIQKRAMNLDLSIVADEAELTELIMKN
jgi:hypothetical protein